MYAPEIPATFSKAARALSLVPSHRGPLTSSLTIDVGIGRFSWLKDVRPRPFVASAACTFFSSREAPSFMRTVPRRPESSTLATPSWDLRAKLTLGVSPHPLPLACTTYAATCVLTSCCATGALLESSAYTGSIASPVAARAVINIVFFIVLTVVDTFAKIHVLASMARCLVGRFHL